jgi:hypothetical protein
MLCGSYKLRYKDDEVKNFAEQEKNGFKFAVDFAHLKT